MKLYRLDLYRFSSTELSGIVKEYQLQLDASELFDLKVKGYHTLFFELKTNRVWFYSLNSNKYHYCISDYVRNILLDSKDAHDPRRTPVEQADIPHNSKVVEGEIDRILDAIASNGINGITISEHFFLRHYSKVTYHEING